MKIGEELFSMITGFVETLLVEFPQIIGVGFSAMPGGNYVEETNDAAVDTLRTNSGVIILTNKNLTDEERKLIQERLIERFFHITSLENPEMYGVTEIIKL